MRASVPGWCIGVYGVLGLLLWSLPLVDRLHVESSAIIALVAFFTAGLSSVRSFEHGDSFGRVLGRQEAALIVPWAMLTVSVLWAPNCGYLQGLMFFGLFPVVTVVLAVALAYALTGTPSNRPGWWLVGIGLVVALGAPLYDLAFHPQFYVYNHVFGGVLGPLYDEALVIRPGMFVFRGLTLLWAALCVVIGRRLRRWRQIPRERLRSVPARAEWAAGIGLALVVGTIYLFGARLGINTPAWYIQEQLGSVYRTAHFDVFYREGSLTPGALRRVAEDHEYHYDRLARLLEVDGPSRVASYLYPDAETKAALTGARVTNVAPIWLRRPQVHVLLDAYDAVFAHELVHVFSRAFGLPVVGASTSVGLMEGLAVALEPPNGYPSSHELVAVGSLSQSAGRPLDATMGAEVLSPLGFWSGRGAVSYAVAGSFVGYLLDAYGPDPFKEAYACGEFEASYGRSAEVLAREWMAWVATPPMVGRATGSLVRRRFTVPSLLERRCPHYVPPHRRRYREGVRVLARKDTARALRALDASMAHAPDFTEALDAWARIQLARGRADTVVARLGALDEQALNPSLSVRLGDARALRHRPGAARARYRTALQQAPSHARAFRAVVLLRKELAARPAAIRILTSGWSPREQADALERLEAGGAADWMRALRLLEAGQGEQAAHLLRTTPIPEGITRLVDRRTLRGQHYHWLARSLYAAGALRQAERVARDGARYYRGIGDVHAAGPLDGMAAKMRWLQGHTQRAS